MTNAAAPQRPAAGQSLLRLAIGVTLAGAALYFYWQNADHLRWSDGVAISVALVCMLAALRLFVESLDPKALAARMEVEGETTPKEAQQARLQSLLFVVLGVSIIWPVIATLRGWPAPAWAYAVTAIFIVIRIAYTMLSWRKADEFTRQRTKNVAWWTFFWSQTGLIAYAGAERLGLAAAMSAWDITVTVTALSIVTAAFLGKSKTTA